MSHANAILTPRGRLRLARCVVDEGWPLRRAAERFQVSVTTASRWAGRYREHGEAGMHDASSRPRTSPWRTCPRRERRIIAIRVNRRWGPARIGYLLGIHPSTVHRVLSRYGLAKLSWLDRSTGRVIRRYEHDSPGDLIHVDIKKLGRIPDGGGHRSLARAAGWRNKTGTAPNRRPGYAFLHNAVDDHSLLAYTEILTDEKKETTALGTRQRLLPILRNHRQTGVDRQRLLLPLLRLQRRPGTGHQAQANPPVQAPDQRQSRALQPHHARRMGLRKTLRIRERPCCRFHRLAPPLQSSPRPHLTQRSATSQPRH